MYRDFHISVRGASHVKADIKCQDSAVSLVDEQGGWAMTAVADGHGGEAYFRSDMGSRFAVESAVSVVQGYLRDMDTFLAVLKREPERILLGMEASIYSKWQTAVEEYDGENLALTPWEEQWCAEKKVTVQEGRRVRLYGTTLVVSILSPHFAIAIQNGDGACAAIYEDGSSEVFLTEKAGERPTNETTSLCNTDAMKHFRHRYELSAPPEGCPQRTDTVDLEEFSEEQEEGLFEHETGATPAKSELTQHRYKLPVCMLTSTDGLFNSCVSTEDFLKFNRRVLSNMNEPEVAQKLETHLYEKRSAMGSMDDISIALTFQSNLNPVDYKVT